MNLRTPAHYYLHIRSGGWQWRIEAHAVVELRHEVTKETVAEVPVSLVVHALTHFVAGAQVTAAFLEPQVAPRPALASAPSPAALRAVGVPLRPVQEARRAARGARQGRRKRTPLPLGGPGPG